MNTYWLYGRALYFLAPGVYVLAASTCLLYLVQDVHVLNACTRLLYLAHPPRIVYITRWLYVRVGCITYLIQLDIAIMACMHLCVRVKLPSWRDYSYVLGLLFHMLGLTPPSWHGRSYGLGLTGCVLGTCHVGMITVTY